MSTLRWEIFLVLLSIVSLPTRARKCQKKSFKVLTYKQVFFVKALAYESCFIRKQKYLQKLLIKHKT